MLGCSPGLNFFSQGFPKIRGASTISGITIIRIIVFWVYIGVPLFREKSVLRAASYFEALAGEAQSHPQT